jgi:hypothetical protein
VGRVRRAALLFLLLFGVYVSTLGIDAAPGLRFAGDEPHYLLAAESIVSDADIDLRDEYLHGDQREWYPHPLMTDGQLVEGRLHEPQGLGFPALIAPAYALGGPTGVQLFLAALWALAWVVAAGLARRLVPEPWATAGPLLCALSPPALGAATAVYPEAPAALALAGAAALALRCRERPRLATALGCGILLATLPWLGPRFLLPGAVIAAALVRWMLRRGRGFYALIAAEAVFTSLVVYVSVNGSFFDGLTPKAAAEPGGGGVDTAFPEDWVARLPRLVAVWIERDEGLLFSAPVLALALLAMWLLWRSRRDRLTRVVPDQWNVEATALLLIAVGGAQVLAAVFLAPSLSGEWFPTRLVAAGLPAAGALAGWGLRHAPRAGTLLGALTLAASVWLYAALRLGDETWSGPPDEVPWGPLEVLFPRFGPGSAYATAAVVAVLAALAAVGLREWQRHREEVALASRHLRLLPGGSGGEGKR